MVHELSGLPLEVLQGCVLVPFSTPKDVAQLLAASSGLRSLRGGYVSGVLDLLFQGRPGAGNAISWIRSHHGNKTGNIPKGNGGNLGLDDVSLAEWLCWLRDTSATGAYRASLGETHSLLVTPGGRALSAGSGRHGVLAASSKMNRFLFTEVDLRWGRFPGRIPVAAVACGQSHTLLLTAVGTVHSCGIGDYGRLGHGNETSLSRPTLIDSLAGERIIQVAAGEAHSVAVSWGGKAYTWGWGYQGILGQGGDADILKPARVVIPAIYVSGDSHGGDSGDSGSGDVVALEDHVTCAAAGLTCTTLGTRHGRVLISGLIKTVTSHRLCFDFYEFGRLGGGLRCWRVQCERLPDPGITFLMAIDSAGQVYEMAPRTGFAFDGNNPEYGDPSEQRRSFSPDGAPCSSVVLSPCHNGDHRRCWLETGGTLGEPGWGLNYTAVGVSRDGRLLVSVGNDSKINDEDDAGEDDASEDDAGEDSAGEDDAGEDDAGEDDAGEDDAGEDSAGEERSVGVGVIHASAWIGDSGELSHGLRLEDGGTSVLTWGDGRTGHLGHGAPAFEPKPKVVRTAVVLGSAASGARSATVHVSVADSSGGSSQEVGSSGGGGGGEAGLRGVLALVDAAADRRDAADDRALAKEEEEGGGAKRCKVSPQHVTR